MTYTVLFVLITLTAQNGEKKEIKGGGIMDNIAECKTMEITMKNDPSLKNPSKGVAVSVKTACQEVEPNLK